MNFTAYEEGYAAFLAGKTREDNPFDKTDSPWSRTKWDKGWVAAARARK